MRRNLPIIWRFIGIGFFWGSGFVWNDIALQSTSWQFATWVRALIGAATISLFLLLAKARTPEQAMLPRSVKIWWHFGVIGVLLAALPNAFWSLGQLGVSASTASIYNATIPIFTAIIAGLVFRVDRLGLRNWLGILIGIVGVVVVIAPWNTTAGANLLPNQLACLASVLSVAIAFAYQRRYLGETTVAPLPAAFIITLGAVAVSVVMTPWWLPQMGTPAPEAWLSLLILGACIGGLAYVWNIRVVEAWGATGASMVTYLTPLVGVSMGVLLLGDHLGWNQPHGGAVIIAGIVVSQSRSIRSMNSAVATRQVLE